MRADGISPTPQFIVLVFVVAILHRVAAASAVCEHSVQDNNKVYHYSLDMPVHNFPYGILSEDGYYKVAANETVVWFQLCGSMIFNHDPPLCIGCKECGGQSRCGMGCSALVSNKIEGYPVCTTIGQPWSTLIDVLDKKSPEKGIIVKMTNSGLKRNCSLSVSVLCNSNGVQGPQGLVNVGLCDYKTELKHPLGCVRTISSNGNGLGWFGTLIILILCLFGSYLLVGAVYRYFFLHIRGIDDIEKRLRFDRVALSVKGCASPRMRKKPRPKLRKKPRPKRKKPRPRLGEEEGAACDGPACAWAAAWAACAWAAAWAEWAVWLRGEVMRGEVVRGKKIHILLLLFPLVIYLFIIP